MVKRNVSSLFRLHPSEVHRVIPPISNNTFARILTTIFRAQTRARVLLSRTTGDSPDRHLPGFPYNCYTLDISASTLCDKRFPSTRPRPVNSTTTCHRSKLSIFREPGYGMCIPFRRRHRTESASPGFKLFFRSFVHLRASGILLSEVGSSHPAAEDARHDPPTYTSATWTGTETEAAAARRGRGTRRGRGSWRGPPGGPV